MLLCQDVHVNLKHTQNGSFVNKKRKYMNIKQAGRRPSSLEIAISVSTFITFLGEKIGFESGHYLLE